MTRHGRAEPDLAFRLKGEWWPVESGIAFAQSHLPFAPAIRYNLVR